ncbi:MAG TPA: 5'-3' exonuclease H3TH domain-containing protein, partial [Candidatus Paceibacterota bacterium]|nr:5'-3' exonuclease H3TH domain-containing protein [Candidatus Paceibacterota bacterium]
FRHEKYSEYKAKRVKQEADFYVQIDKVKNILRLADIKYFEKAGFEADDIIGTVSRLAAEADQDLRIIIVTGDLDTLQLVNNQISVYTFHQGIKNEVLYDPAKIKERFNLTPGQLIDYKSLRGDPSDNILGVKGVGEKGALRLLTLYPSLEDIYLAIENGSITTALTSAKDKSLIAKLKAQKDQAYFSKCLVTIDRQVPIDFSLKDVVFNDFNYEALEPLFKDLGFTSLIKKAKEGVLDQPAKDYSPPSFRNKSYNKVSPQKKIAAKKVIPPSLF